MDLMLSNVIVDSPSAVTKKRASPEPVRRNAIHNGGAFSISFSKALPSKALVARRKNVGKVPSHTISKTMPSTQQPTMEISQDAENQKCSIGQHKAVGNSKVITAKKTANGPSKAGLEAVCKLQIRGKKSTKLVEQTLDERSHKNKPLFNFQHDSTSINRFSLFDRLKTDLPKLELPRVKPLTEQVFSEQPIDTLEIHPHTKKNITDCLNYTHLTIVQVMAIPRLMEGRDMLIRAQTGSGKTLAYALPLIEQLHKTRPKTSRTDGILAVVIVPTRELALQTYELMVKLLKPYTWIVSGFLCGGEKRKAEKARLRAGLNILIGTPGRFCDHIRNTESLKLGNVRWLVLDEADRLLELGYEKDVKEIVSAIQGDWCNTEDTSNISRKDGSLQTVLLSATLTASVKELAGLTLRHPVYIETSEAIRNRQMLAETFDKSAESGDHLLNMDECVSIPSTAKQCYLVIPPKLRLVTLSGLIAHEQHKKPSKALVFMATQDLVDFHYDVMVEVLTSKQLDSDDENENEVDDDNDELVLLPKVAFFKLHGGMTQVERSSVFLKFRTAKAAVLLCTDMVARGIDIPCVDLVVQYHAPQLLADYVHRVGRTARAGHSGKAVLFLEPAEVDFIKYLTDKQISLQEQKIDGIFVHLGQRLKCGQKTIAKNKEQAAIVLQRRFEQLIAKEKELFSSASKAFVSWVRYYSNFPRELRRIFAMRAIHMGHYAQCLGLRDAPKQFMHVHTGPKDEETSKAAVVAGTASDRSKYENSTKHRGKGVPQRFIDADGKKRLREKRGSAVGQTMATFAKRSRVLNTSEFDSGLGPARQKFKQ